MVSENFEVDDLVWAKMKGYPPWPARIAEPGSDTKTPKNKKSHFVHFFGSENFAWITDENISPHSESKIVNMVKKKAAGFQNAVDALSNYLKTNNKKEKYSSSPVKKDEDDKKPENKVVKVVNRVPKKHKKQVVVNKSRQKKIRKKRSLENDTNGDNASSPSKVFKSNDYSFTENFFFDTSMEEMSNMEVRHVKPTGKKIGFIGLGNMGQAIVKNLLKSGHDVTVWNRNFLKSEALIEEGISVAKHACDLITQCDITFCCVSDPEASKTLIFGENGILKGLEESEKLGKRGKGYVEMTSIDPVTSSAISEAITTKQGKYLEAPVCGTSKNAEDGSLLILASGDRKLFLDCITCFHAMGKHAYYVSCDVGYGTKMSLLLSMVYGTVCAAVSEAMALAERLKVPHEEFIRVLSLGPLHCDSIIDKCKMMGGHSIQPAVTPLKHIQKDLNLALMMADDNCQPMPVTAAANEIYKRGRLMKYSDLDISAVYRTVKF